MSKLIIINTKFHKMHLLLLLNKQCRFLNFESSEMAIIQEEFIETLLAKWSFERRKLHLPRVHHGHRLMYKIHKQTFTVTRNIGSLTVTTSKPNLSRRWPATALLSQLHSLPVSVNSRITFKLARLTYKLLTTGQPAYLRTRLHH